MARLSLKKKIIKSQRELLSIFDSITDPICIIDETFTIKRLNHRLAELFGLGIKDTIGRKCHKLILDRDRPCKTCYFKGGDGNVRNIECSYIKRPKESDDLIYELTLYPYHTGDGKSAIFHFKDVTDRVKVEGKLSDLNDLLEKSVGEKDSELRNTRAKFEKIIRHSPLGIAILDEKETLITANPTFEGIIGLGKDELSGKGFLEIVDKKDGDEFIAFFKRLRTEGAYSIDIAIQNKNGIEKHLFVTGLILGGGDCDSSDIVVMIQDITERKRALLALKESEETARALLNATTDSAALISPDGVVIAINETAAKVLKKGVDELIGMSLYNDFRENDLVESLKARGDEVIRDGRPIRYEDERKGSFFDNSIYPVFNVNKKVERFAVFSHDISRQKMFIQELISRETMAALGRMSASLSHELKKPILGIKNHLDLLRGKLKDEPEKIAPLDRSIEELIGVRDLIERMRKFYIPKKSKKTTANLNDLIIDLLPLVEARLRENNIVIKTSLSDKLPMLSVFPTKIRQAIVHIVNNAEDAMSKGGIIRISTQRRGDKVKIIVEDQGKGMDKKALAEISDPNYMGERNRVALGFYICRDIMAKHGGSVDIRSTKGEGTRVVLNLPFSPDQA